MFQMNILLSLKKIGIGNVHYRREGLEIVHLTVGCNKTHYFEDNAFWGEKFEAEFNYEKKYFMFGEDISEASNEKRPCNRKRKTKKRERKV